VRIIIENVSPAMKVRTARSRKPGEVLWVGVIMLALFVVAECGPAKDYYRILGVPTNASEKDIKKAYKKLSRKYHPDVVPEKDKAEAQKKFVEIAEAYGTLKDKKKRDVYDRGGHDAVRDFEQHQNNPEGPGGFHGGGFPGGGGNFHFTSGGPGGGGGGFDFSDLFGSFFGGGGGGGGRKQKRGGGGGGGFGGFGRFGGHDAHGDFGDMGFGGQQQQQPNPKPFKDSDVILLDKDSIYEIDNRRRLVLAVYFTNEALQADEFDTIKKFATKYKGIMNVIGVDCKKQKDICSSHGVKSVPLFRVYPQDKSKATVDFKGKISIPMLEQQTINRLENFVVKVGQRSIAGLKERALKESKQLFIIFPTKQSTSPMFMSLSTVSSC
jgi:curved DNA-binding protein CbpA